MNFLAARDFVAAMVRSPLDRVLPLVYADWLEEHDQPERAEWVRLGVRLAEPCPAREELGRLVGRRRKLWKRARPAYWGRAFGPDAGDPAAFVRLTLQPHFGAGHALIREDWPQRALADGWLGEVECWPWRADPAPFAAALAGSLAGVPLALGLHSAERGARVVGRLFGGLAALPTLTRLTLRYLDEAAPAPAPAGGSWLARVFAAAPPLPRDETILRLAPLKNLRLLTLQNCPGVTDAGVAALQAAVPGLVVRLNGATVVSPARRAPEESV